MAAVRSSWNEPAPFAEPDGSAEAPLQQPTDAPPRAGRPALRVRRPAVAPAAQPPPPAQPAAAPEQAVEQQPAPAPFMFGTPGAGPSTAKALRPKGRSPAAPSPVFTTSSAASMAWSPYPATSSAEASTAFGGATPAPPGSATPTSGPAPAAAAAACESPAASVAADLQARLDLSSGSNASGSSSADGLTADLRDRLHLGGEQKGASAAPAPAAAAAPAAGGRPAPFGFVFGAAAAPAPSTQQTAASWGADMSFKETLLHNPAAARHQPSSTLAAGAAAPSAAAAATGPTQGASSAPQPPAAGTFMFGAAAAAAASAAARLQSSGSEATADAGPSAAAAASSEGTAAAPQPPAPEAFVFGVAAPAAAAAPSSSSPAALRARHRTRSHTRSPQQAAVSVRARTAAAAASSGSVSPEPLQEIHQQQSQQQSQQQPAPCFMGLGAAGKPQAVGASPVGFAAAGTSARRPPSSRRKAAHPARSSGSVGTPRRHSSSEEAATSAPPAAAAAPSAPAPASPAGGDAQQKAAYSRSEMYRSQGNEAFRDGAYAAAYDLYTKALQALWPHPPLHPRLALLLSNRAAALLSQGKPLSALEDCQMGLKYDPSLTRCALRVATCHSRMGNFDEAFACVTQLREKAAGKPEQLREVEAKQRDLEEQERQMYEALRSLGHVFQAPRRDPATGAALERSASTGGLSRAASSSTAAPATAEAFWEALKRVDEVAPHVPHSELLLAAKAEGLLRLGKHERVREFCSQAVHEDQGSHQAQQKKAPWRLWVKAQCSWAEGDTGGGLKQQLQALLAALELQQQQRGGSGGAAAGQQKGAGAAAAAVAAPSAFFPGATVAPAASQQEQRRAEQLAQLVGLPAAADVTALLEGLETADKRRLAGNAAVKAGKAAEAVQKYSEALAAIGLSPAIAAVLLSNRAAAHQHLKQRAQAIADCCRSVALSPHYAKAHSRLATLLSELGYHSDAASALEAAAAAPGVSSADRRGYQQRLEKERAAAKRAASRISGLGSQAPLDHYKLLGLEKSTASEDVRKVYKKLALQLHPDKAASVCRLATRCCGCGSPLFEALAAQQRLQDRATWLFKLLGEANEVLSDASKRRELDHALRRASSAARGGPSAFAGGFSSYYGGSDEEDGDYFGASSFGGYGGRRYGAAAGGFGGAGTYGYGAPGGNPYARGTGGGAGSRYWGYY